MSQLPRSAQPVQIVLLLLLPLLLLPRLLRLWKLPRGLPSKIPVSIFTAAVPGSGSQPPSSAGGVILVSAGSSEICIGDERMPCEGAWRARLLPPLLLLLLFLPPLPLSLPLLLLPE